MLPSVRKATVLNFENDEGHYFCVIFVVHIGIASFFSRHLSPKSFHHGAVTFHASVHLLSPCTHYMLMREGKGREEYLVHSHCFDMSLCSREEALKILKKKGTRIQKEMYVQATNSVNQFNSVSKRQGTSDL